MKKETSKAPKKAPAKAKAKAPVKAKAKAKAPVKATAKAKAPVKKSAARSARSVLATQSLSLSAPALTLAAHFAALRAAPNVVPILTKAFHEIIDTTVMVQNALPGGPDLTGAQRRRLFSARARKWGFITKTWETIDAWPDFAPPNFSIPEMSKMMANAENARQLLTLVQQLAQFLDDYLLTTNDELYRDGLRVYGTLREQARARVPGAEKLFAILRQFFTLHRRGRAATEPTEAELEREFRQLVKKRADGEIIIKNESPHMVGGVHEVVENVRKKGKRGAEIKVEEEE